MYNVIRNKKLKRSKIEMITNEKIYWCNNGAEQAKYDEMKNANFNFTRKSEMTFYLYHRFYNDGDMPPMYRTYPDAYARLMEDKATKQIISEYKRYTRQLAKQA